MRGERTRAKLVGAAIDVLRTEGMGALSVTELTRRVGVHSSLFYTHFKDLDECLGMAAHSVLASLGPRALQLLSDAVCHVVTDQDELQARCAAALDEWLEQRPFVEILLAHRFDRSPMGEALRGVLAEQRAAFMANIWGSMSRLGVPTERVAEAGYLADMALNHWLWALECAIEERIPQRSQLAELLANQLVGGTAVALMRGTRPSLSEAVAQDLTPEHKTKLVARRRHFRGLLADNDDAAMVAMVGGLEDMVILVMRLMCGYYLPSRGAYDLRVRIRVHHDGQVLDNDLWTEGGTCHTRLARDCDGPPPQAVVSMPLRTLFDVAGGRRTYGECFAANELAVEGDPLVLLQMLQRFFMP